MIYAAQLAIRNIRLRLVQSLLTILVVGLAVGLTIVVVVVADAVRNGVVRASDGFGVLVVGPKGSSQQLVLNSILLQDAPVGVMSSEVFTELEQSEPTAVIAPLAMGDNVNGALIIGTDQNFFQLRPSAGEPPLFKMAGGRLFTSDFEAVLGSEAARGLTLQIGDRFYSAHGFGRGLSTDVHKQTPYTIVGVLAPTHTPYDRAVFTTVDSIWTAHAGESGAAGAQTNPGAEQALDAMTAVRGQLTAALVMPYGLPLSEIYTIAQETNNGTLAQAVFPGAELGKLFNLMDSGQVILQMIGWLTLAMASITILLSLYAATLARQQEIAVIRSLGANRVTVFIMTLLEAIALALAGVVLGLLLGHAIAAELGQLITQRSAIVVETRILWQQELVLLLLPLLLGILSGLLPAIMAYRVNVIERLFPQ